MSTRPITNTLNAADVIKVIEGMAPPVLAEEWDNCGLQVGSGSWPVRKIWVALDPLLEVVRAAVDQRVDMIITHHPLLFRALRTVDVETVVGKVIETALCRKLTIYSAHTNLDSASGGINHMLAEIIGLNQAVPMVGAHGSDDSGRDDAVTGMGRVGRLAAPMTLDELARTVKSRLGLTAVKVVGRPETVVRRAAVCSGAGSGLLDAFLAGDADVYLTGDIRYHDARTVEDAGRALIDVGHFASERIFIDRLVEQLRRHAHEAGWAVDIESCTIESDPFTLVS